MIVDHDGTNIPTLPGFWPLGQTETVFFDPAPVVGDAGIDNVEWSIPYGWTVIFQYDAITATVDGEDVESTYGVLLSAPGGAECEGRVAVRITFTLSDGRVLPRSAYIYQREI